jgi:hypothetical protein
MFLEDDEWVRIAIGTLRVVLKRPYITDEIAALIKGEIEELRGEMRNASMGAGDGPRARAAASPVGSVTGSEARQHP